MDTAQFVSDLNVSRFLDRLQLEHDPSIRASLQRLLLEEEDNFGDRAERLHNPFGVAARQLIVIPQGGTDIRNAFGVEAVVSPPLCDRLAAQ